MSIELPGHPPVTTPLPPPPIPSPRSGITITWDELDSPAVEEQVAAIREARQVQMVRPVGAPTDVRQQWWRSAIATMTLTGLVAGLFAFGLIELAMSPDSDSSWYGDSATTSNVLMTVVTALAIGLVIVTWDAWSNGGWGKVGRSLAVAGPVLLVGGLVGGLVTDAVYQQMIDNLISEALTKPSLEDALAYMQTGMHVPRAIAYGLVGVVVGAGLGASSRSGRRTINGVVGGLVGGLVGGWLFDYFSSGTISRAAAFTIMGTLIGLAIGLVETARREHWLEILSGGMAGKQFILYHADSVVGSSPAAQITLIKDPGIAPEHARLKASPRGLEVSTLTASAPVLVNGAPTSSAVLSDGSTLQLGSTLLRYRDKKAVAPVAGPIVG